MGNITLEQIDLIMQRANVSYAEAKEALESANGDILEALLILEKGQKIKPEQTSHQNTSHETREKINNFINKLNATSFIMSKKGRTFIDVPLSVAIIGTALCLPFSVIGLIIALVFGVKVNVKGENEIARKINSTINDLSK